MILLLGATGQLGTAMARMLDEYVAPTHAEIDLSRLEGEQADRLLSETRPEVVLNCAAYTTVDKAEEEEQTATAVNGTAVGVLAEATAKHDIPFVTFSTDYVFDGTGSEPYVEFDPTAPINAYGRSKLVGENLALATNPRTLVIRTSWVVSGTHPNFVATMLRLASHGRHLTVVDDQVGRPTVAADLASGTIDAIEKGSTGLLHMTNEGSTTWFDLARESVGLAGLDTDLIQPCPTEDYPTPAARPAYSVLGSERRQTLGVDPLPHWRESLPNLVSQLQGR